MDTEPKRRYTVAALEGTRRYFARQDKAVEFAASQARQSWSTPEWSVADRSANTPHRRLLVNGLGVIVGKIA